MCHDVLMVRRSVIELCSHFSFSLKANEQRRAELFTKQGRGQQFSNVKERDSWIKKVRVCDHVCTGERGRGTRVLG